MNLAVFKKNENTMKPPFTRYTKADVEFIKNNLDKGNNELGEILGRSADSVKHKMKSEGLSRTKEQVSALRRAWNPSHFEKGSVPHNYKNGQYMSKDGYIMKSVGQSVQRLKHVWRWEKINGPLPDGYCLRSKDRSRTNTDPDNWELISRRENMLMNTIHRYPKKVKTAMITLAKLKKQL